MTTEQAAILWLYVGGVILAWIASDNRPTPRSVLADLLWPVVLPLCILAVAGLHLVRRVR